MITIDRGAVIGSSFNVGLGLDSILLRPLNNRIIVNGCFNNINICIVP